jgi:hypothetical protein
MNDTMTDTEKALRLLVQDRKIARFLRDHDPKALAQAETALGLAPRRSSQTRGLLNGLRAIAGDVDEAIELSKTVSAGDGRDGIDSLADVLDSIEDRVESVRDALADILYARTQRADASYGTRYSVTDVARERDL